MRLQENNTTNLDPIKECLFDLTQDVNEIEDDLDIMKNRISEIDNIQVRTIENCIKVCDGVINNTKKTKEFKDYIVWLQCSVDSLWSFKADKDDVRIIKAVVTILCVLFSVWLSVLAYFIFNGN